MRLCVILFACSLLFSSSGCNTLIALADAPAKIRPLSIHANMTPDNQETQRPILITRVVKPDYVDDVVPQILAEEDLSLLAKCREVKKQGPPYTSETYWIKPDAQGEFEVNFGECTTFTGGAILLYVIKIGWNKDENILVCRQNGDLTREIFRFELKKRSVNIWEYDPSRAAFVKAASDRVSAQLRPARKKRFLAIRIGPPRLM